MCKTNRFAILFMLLCLSINPLLPMQPKNNQGQTDNDKPGHSKNIAVEEKKTVKYPAVDPQQQIEPHTTYLSESPIRFSDAQRNLNDLRICDGKLLWLNTETFQIKDDISHENNPELWHLVKIENSKKKSHGTFIDQCKNSEGSQMSECVFWICANGKGEPTRIANNKEILAIAEKKALRKCTICHEPFTRENPEHYAFTSDSLPHHKKCIENWINTKLEPKNPEHQAESPATEATVKFGKPLTEKGKLLWINTETFEIKDDISHANNPELWHLIKIEDCKKEPHEPFIDQHKNSKGCQMSDCVFWICANSTIEPTRIANNNEIAAIVGKKGYRNCNICHEPFTLENPEHYEDTCDFLPHHKKCIDHWFNAGLVPTNPKRQTEDDAINRYGGLLHTNRKLWRINTKTFEIKDDISHEPNPELWHFVKIEDCKKEPHEPFIDQCKNSKGCQMSDCVFWIIANNENEQTRIATPDEINAITIKKDYKTCRYCYGSFTRENPEHYAFSCDSHPHHKECLDIWMKNGNTPRCPECHAEILSKEINAAIKFGEPLNNNGKLLWINTETFQIKDDISNEPNPELWHLIKIEDGKQRAHKPFIHQCKNSEGCQISDCVFWIIANGKGEPTRTANSDEIQAITEQIGYKDCSICLAPFTHENPEYYAFNCNHHPCHKECAESWIKAQKKPACPVCRAPLETINVPDQNGMTQLHHAVINVQPNKVKFLLEHGASVNAQDNKKRSPLHYATLKDQIETNIVQLLFEYGAELNIKDQCGITPLFLATLYNNAKMVELLLNHGADANIKNNYGQTPLAMAENQMNAGVIGLDKVYKLLLNNKKKASYRRLKSSFHTIKSFLAIIKNNPIKTGILLVFAISCLHNFTQSKN